MRYLSAFAFAAVVSCSYPIAYESPLPGSPGCGLEQAAFCDTFDTPAPGGNGGDLDDLRWSPARVTTNINPTQAVWNAFPAPGPGTACGDSTEGRLAPDDMFFCAGGPTESMHFNSVSADGGAFTIHSWRIRQLFDFTDRTGIIAFDVTAKAQLPGGHGYWFNVFVSEEPVPAPYHTYQGFSLKVKAGVGIEFIGIGQCPADGTQNAVTSVSVLENYQIRRNVGFTDSDFGNEQTGGPGSALCFDTANEVLNHIEIHINRSTIEIYASDAGEPESLRLVAVANNLSLPFSRGYVSFQQIHNNASSCTTLLVNPLCVDCANIIECAAIPDWITYQMDNIGFDGPAWSTPRSYQAPDSNLTDALADPFTTFVVLPLGTTINGQPTEVEFPARVYRHTAYDLVTTWDGYNGAIGVRRPEDPEFGPLVFENVHPQGGSDPVLTMNVWGVCDTLMYRANNRSWRSFHLPDPIGDSPNCLGFNAVQLPLEISDLVEGTNVIEFYNVTTDVVGGVFANIELTIAVD